MKQSRSSNPRLWRVFCQKWKMQHDWVKDALLGQVCHGRFTARKINIGSHRAFCDTSFFQSIKLFRPTPSSNEPYSFTTTVLCFFDLRNGKIHHDSVLDHIYQQVSTGTGFYALYRSTKILKYPKITCSQGERGKERDRKVPADRADEWTNRSARKLIADKGILRKSYHKSGEIILW